MICSSLTSIAVIALAGLAQGAPTSNLRSWEEAYAKAEQVVDQMSLEQKVGLTTGIGWEKTLCVGNVHGTEDPYFPSLCLQDGPLGTRFASNNTAGVSGINAAATFDRDLMYRRAEIIGNESRGKGVHIQLGPSVDLIRAPHGGRGWEAFGEDPYLQGVGGYEFVKGVQSQNVIATAKHYILNNQEINRTTSNSVVDERTLREIYVWPYARMVEAGLGSVMCSYNLYEDIYACENDYLLNTVLKEELSFKGFVMSDWGATHSTAPSVNAGLDMTMPGDIIMGDGLSWFGPNLTKAVEDGDVSEERVTDMAMRIAAAHFKVGQDKDFPETSLVSFDRKSEPEVIVTSDEHIKFVRDIGAASVVLLANDGILPVSSDDLQKIAIVGSDAAAPSEHGGLNEVECTDMACNDGTYVMGWGSGSVDFPYIISPTEGITNRAGDSVEVVHTYDDWDTEAAAELASDADIAFVFAKTEAGEEYLMVDGNNDRKNLTLWNNGDNLIQAVADANENTVVVIHSPGPILMPWIDHENIKAVVWPGLPGQETGNSLADVLFGDVNPSGRLPYTIAKKEEDYGAHISTEYNIEYSEKLNIGYRHFDANDIEPLFAFGYGLSYSTFDYGKLKVNTKRGKRDTLATATVFVRNTGDVDGAEVAQAYISFPESAGEPPKVLRGFERVYLKAGQQRKVTFEFTETDLSIYDEESSCWVVPEGEYTVSIGASSRDIRESATFDL
ncbi:glycoside hydrolase superfamily [Zychaea mexicana]|uniref:glycoside hydrolase superfamily n=1 Tax=Zychaea mexicana TaxID=64656 RepID=UPI0022FF1A81|nr:glycoside hydrolase superfamily [Zychaea mexicana]KAI9493632.1 glycoside hydrolase superfamily [Zychaea mexicana]